jgi:nucleotide-binding universal stress UspA family protein
MKLLLGVGGTDDSFRALDRTVERAREAGDDLTVAVLHNPASEPDPGAVERRVRDALDEAEFDASVVVLEGDPGSELVELADREGYDRIVLGGGERSPMGKVTLGHVSEFVLMNAQTTVTLIR